MNKNTVKYLAIIVLGISSVMQAETGAKKENVIKRCFLAMDDAVEHLKAIKGQKQKGWKKRWLDADVKQSFAPHDVTLGECCAKKKVRQKYLTSDKEYLHRICRPVRRELGRGKFKTQAEPAKGTTF